MPIPACASLHIKRTYVAIGLIFRPCVSWPFVYYFGDVDKPSINHLLLVTRAAVCKSIDARRRFQHGIPPLLYERIVFESVVDALRMKHYILELKPTTRLKIIKALGHKLWPVAHRVNKHASKDEIERVRVVPIVFNVIDYKANIGRNAMTGQIILCQGGTSRAAVRRGEQCRERYGKRCRLILQRGLNRAKVNSNNLFSSVG